MRTCAYILMCGLTIVPPIMGGKVIAQRGHKNRVEARDAQKKRPKARERAAMSRAHRLGLGTRAVAGKLMTGRVLPSWVRAGGGTMNQLPGILRWPVAKGWMSRGWGSGEGGYHLALDIMGKTGVPVRAAASGIVAYSGDDVPGFGNLVILVHSGGWVTMYAHNSKNLVIAGERVDKGAVIAELGSTGRSRGPHVHFEFIAEGKNCDPVPLFRPGVPRRYGPMRSVHRAVWKSRKPGSIRCDRRRHHPKSVAAAQNDPTESLVDMDTETLEEGAEEEEETVQESQ